MPDEHLIDLVDRLPRRSFQGEAFRHVGPQYPPLSGEGARIQGGRWNPPDSFPTLYMGLSRETVIAEFYRRAEREARPPEDLLPRRLYRYRIHLSQVMDLTQPGALGRVDLTVADLSAVDPLRCREVGDASHYVGFEAIQAPSGTGFGEVLAVFFDRLAVDSLVEHVDHETWKQAPPTPQAQA